MTPPAASTFLLRWKGVESGPFTIDEIRERLDQGEISRMHQVQVKGAWRLLDDLAELNPPEAGDVRQQVESLRREFEERLAAERGHDFLEAMPADAQPIFDMPATTRTSGVAIAALIAGLCCFIPYVNWIAWIPALALGHLALTQIQRDATLGGKWMAVAALVAGYFIIMGGTYAVLTVWHGRSLF